MWKGSVSGSKKEAAKAEYEYEINLPQNERSSGSKPFRLSAAIRRTLRSVVKRRYLPGFGQKSVVSPYEKADSLDKTALSRLGSDAWDDSTGNALSNITAWTAPTSFFHNLPRGVDLHCLQDPGFGKSVPYFNAFTESGGEAKRKAGEARMRALILRVNLSSDSIPKCTQDPVFQMYDLASVIQDTTRGDLRIYGEQELEKLSPKLQSKISYDINIYVPPAKGIRRSRIKAQIKYGNDLSHLTDLNRATISCPDMMTMLETTEYIVNKFGCVKGMGNPDRRVAQIEDLWFTNPSMASNYRHIIMLIDFRGIIWEVQINTAPMLREKNEKGGHKHYATTRYVQESILLASVHGLTPQLQKFFSHPGVNQVANCNLITDKNGLASLHHASFRGDLVCVKLLVDHGANPWKMDCFGRPPLFYALKFGREDVYNFLSLLMLASASPREELDTIWTALEPCLPFCTRLPNFLSQLLEPPRMAERLQAKYASFVKRDGSTEIRLLFTATGVPLSNDPQLFLPYLRRHAEETQNAAMVASMIQSLEPGWDLDWRKAFAKADLEPLESFLTEIADCLKEVTWNPRKIYLGMNDFSRKKCGIAWGMILQRCCEADKVDFSACNVGQDFLNGFVDGWTRHDPVPRSLRTFTTKSLVLSANSQIGNGGDLGKFLSMLRPPSLDLFDCELTWMLIRPVMSSWCLTLIKLTMSWNNLRAPEITEECKEKPGPFWDFIKACPNIKEMYLVRCQMNPEVFAMPSGDKFVHDNLEILNIRENPYLGTAPGGEALVEIFNRCPNLQELDVGDCDIQEALKRINMRLKRHNLKNLILDENPSLGKEAKHLARLLSYLPSLQSIIMDRCGWTLSGLSELLVDSWKLLRLKTISLKSNDALLGDDKKAVSQKLQQFQREKCQNAELEIIMDSAKRRNMNMATVGSLPLLKSAKLS